MWHLLLYWKREPTEEERQATRAEPLYYKISLPQYALFPDLQNFREHPDYEEKWKENYSLIVRVIFLIVLHQLHELGELIYLLSHPFAVSSLVSRLEYSSDALPLLFARIPIF